MDWTVQEIGRDRKEDALDVLCAAFDDYPVMRYVVGPPDAGYADRVRELIGFFVEARLARNVPLLGLLDGAALAAVAVLSSPHDTPMPPALVERHARLQRCLGAAAMARFDAYDEACEATDPGHVAHYLGMIATHPRRRGSGGGR